MASGDLRRALDGDTSPGADSQLLASWSKDFWQMVHGQERSAERQQRLAPLIEQLGKEYPEIKTLSEPVFLRWVAAAVALPEKSSVTIKGDTLDVLVRERDLPAVAAKPCSQGGNTAVRFQLDVARTRRAGRAALTGRLGFGVQGIPRFVPKA
jgi:hypothetical protein